MHDIDRTLMEIDPETEYEPEFESADEYGEFEESDTEAVFDEAEEMELAAELLGITDEAELDQFWGSLIKKAGKAIGKFVKTPTGQALKGILKGAAKKYLPTVGSALGTVIGGPAGTVLGGQLASQAGRVFGLELEGLSPEEQEFEMAKGMVRFGAEAAKNAALTPSSGSPPSECQGRGCRSRQAACSRPAEAGCDAACVRLHDDGRKRPERTLGSSRPQAHRIRRLSSQGE